jgi:hypothetical protein
MDKRLSPLDSISPASPSLVLLSPSSFYSRTEAAVVILLVVVLVAPVIVL